MTMRALLAVTALPFTFLGAGCGTDPTPTVTDPSATPAAMAEATVKTLDVPGTTSFTWSADHALQLQIQRPLDALSATLAADTAQGTALPRVTIPIVTPAGDKITGITLRDALLVAYVVGPGAVETVTFVFGRISFQ